MYEDIYLSTYLYVYVNMAVYAARFDSCYLRTKR